ncbi:MAG: tyrosine-type recombinase/integrase [Solirubrobacteraceae bacterium]
MFNALSDFAIHCRVERRLADLTCTAYERDVHACLEHLQDRGIAALADVRTPDLRRFLAEEATHRPSPSSQARTTAALRCFFRFCVENEYIERDPASVLRSPKQREALLDIIDRAELSRLLSMPSHAGVWNRLHAGKRERDQLLLALFAYGGLRHGELLGLDWDDVDLERRVVRVRHAKGGRQRAVPIHPGLVPLFLAYRATRTPLGDPAVFVGVYGRRLSPTLLTRTFRRYATAAGVNEHKRVTPHTLRHVFATELLSAGANLRQIQELLGHKHLDSTQRYTRVNAHQLRGAVKRLPWASQTTT